MTRPPSSSLRRPALATVALTAGALLAGLAAGPGATPGLAVPAPAAPTVADVASPEQAQEGLPDTDARGTARPTAAQLSAARSFGATVRWNSFGTPATISPRTGTLGRTTSSDPVVAARSWLRSHAAVLGLSTTQVDRLRLVRSQRLAGSRARAVLFRQDLGGPAPALGSQVTVGVGGGGVQHVSSSLVRVTGTAGSPTLSPTQAWRRAAADVGRDVTASALDGVVERLGWTRFRVEGLAQEQQVRLRSLALADGTVRPVFEANVVDVRGGAAAAWTLLVDAASGKVLVRQDRVDHSSDAQQFSGSTTATACGPRHTFALTDDKTRSIVATAAAVVTTNDIVVKILGPDGGTLATSDSGTSPEVATYAAASIPAGSYAMQVCPFDDPTVPFTAPGTYAGGVVTSDTGTPTTPTLGNPRWRFFPANPSLDWRASTTPANSVVGCWSAAAGCTLPSGQLKNVAAAGPWDLATRTGTPTLTTTGNNATTHEAWLSPLTPGGLLQAPVSPTRAYTQPFTDAWNNSRCDPTQLRPGGNDVDAAVTNLFVAHNRMHDFSYYLGFTEENYNLQTDNLGRNDDPTRADDPEVGNAQAGALTGGQPSFLGRDNANQIALQDGIPGITNQYLFQPIAGAFYSPCTDGSLDMSIVGHEYTHAISNRMVGGPDEGLTSEQGGAMGESWSDLTAAEYLFEHGYPNGADPWAVGPYATGNKRVGIRDYAIDANPLNYGDYGFDSTGDEVHADGEIWNGTMWEVRQALVKKYDASYPSTSRALNLRCAQATATTTPTPATQCPGNRRWLQLVFDSFLLQQGDTSMLDARDAMLAADRMRFGGADQSVIWEAFARRGMGSDARTPDADSGDPTPGFVSPRSTPASVEVVALSPGGTAVEGRLYVGDYEARATPVADTVGATSRSSTARLTRGSYRLTFVAPGYGITRSNVTVGAGQRTTTTLRLATNLASATQGATLLAASPGSRNAAALIDDTEATSWAGVEESESVDDATPSVAVDLAGSAPRTIRSVRVSAMLRPAEASGEELPLAAATDEDPDSGARFTALRRFAIETCTSGCGSASARWTRIWTSPADAFPAVAPRPVAPDLRLRSFDVPDVQATAVRLVALENQCTGAPAYAGEQDADPVNDTDCKAASDADLSVRAAELEVF